MGDRRRLNVTTLGAAAAVVVVSGFVIAGCGDDSGPGAVSASSTSVEASSTTVAPAKPASAVEVARGFLDAYGAFDAARVGRIHARRHHDARRGARRHERVGHGSARSLGDGGDAVRVRIHGRAVRQQIGRGHHRHGRGTSRQARQRGVARRRRRVAGGRVDDRRGVVLAQSLSGGLGPQREALPGPAAHGAQSGRSQGANP